MGKFIAKLVGESDGHTVIREFGDKAAAIAWLQGAGLAEFEDQSASGEVQSVDGLIWKKSNLQTKERARRDDTVRWRRFFARNNITPRKR